MSAAAASSPIQPVLDVRNVTKSYPGVRALEDVTLDIVPGEIHAIIGPNGAGKSTLFGVLSGEFPPSEGEVLFKGDSVAGKRADRMARGGIARAFQIPRIFGGLTVRENVLVALLGADGIIRRRHGIRGFVRPIEAHVKEIDELLARYGLRAEADVVADNVSHGHKKRLEVTMALALEPEVLLLDEPTAGMAPDETRDTVELLRQLGSDRDITMVLTEHDMSVVFTLADRISVLNGGRLLTTGEPQVVRKNPQVIEVYLGKEAEAEPDA